MAKKKDLWKKEDMQRGNRVGAHRRTVQDKRASLNQVAGDPEPVEGSVENPQKLGKKAHGSGLATNTSHS